MAVPLCDNPALAFSKQQARKLLDLPRAEDPGCATGRSRSVRRSDFGARRSRLTFVQFTSTRRGIDLEFYQAFYNFPYTDYFAFPCVSF